MFVCCSRLGEEFGGMIEKLERKDLYEEGIKFSERIKYYIRFNSRELAQFN